MSALRWKENSAAIPSSEIGKVILLDEEYGAYGGHQASYDLPVCEELKRRGVPFYLLADSQLNVPTEYARHVIPTFHTRAATRLQSQYLPRLINRVVATLIGNVITIGDLARRVSARVAPGDLILLCRPLSRTRVAYAVWLWILAWRSCPVTVVYVVHNEPEPLFGVQVRLLRRLASRHRLVFIAHSPAIARLVSTSLGVTPTVVALPFRAAPFVARHRARGEATRFAFLGLGHHTKGLDLVVCAVQSSAGLLATKSVSFTIQCYLPFTDAATEQLLQRARALQSEFPGVEILDGELTPAEYLRQLQHTDFVLIPHRLETYRFALSGVFADAMNAGRPVVVGDGSYMSEIVHESGAGVTFESGDAASLTEAIREGAEHADELLERAAEASSNWVKEQGPSAFVSRLLTIHADAKPTL